MVSKFLKAFTATIALASFASASPLSLFRRTDPLPVCVCDVITPPKVAVIIGQVKTEVFITYEILDGYFVVRYPDVIGHKYQSDGIHLYLSTTAPSQHSPGQFPYTVGSGHCVVADDSQTAICKVLVSELGPDLCADPTKKYFIATHAAHFSETDPTSSEDNETSWGEGSECFINPKTSACRGWAQYSSFTLSCRPPPSNPPTGGNEECGLGTGFGYAKSVNAQPFLLNSIGEEDGENGANRWGEGFGFDYSPSGSISGIILVGAGGNDPTKATEVGTFLYTWSTSNIFLTVILKAGFGLNAAHVYSKCTMPTSVNPGGYGNTFDRPGIESSTTYTFTITPSLSCADKAFAILHFEVTQTKGPTTVCEVPKVPKVPK